MSSDDYQVQNIYRYSRRSYKKNRRETNGDDDISPCESVEIDSPEVSPRSDGVSGNSPGCRCDLDHEVEIANILHKKCPVITLAQQQLQRLLDETDKILCDNTKCCRSIYDFLCLCQAFLSQDRCRCVLIFCIAMSFFTGLLFGAASCGSYLVPGMVWYFRLVSSTPRQGAVLHEDKQQLGLHVCTTTEHGTLGSSNMFAAFLSVCSIWTVFTFIKCYVIKLFI